MQDKAAKNRARGTARKLTAAQVQKARRLHEAGSTVATLAKQVGLDYKSTQRMLRRETYKEI